MSRKYDYDVVIVGAGLAGAAAAVALSQSGLSVALIDSQDPQQTSRSTVRTHVDSFSPRVSAITPSNALWLESIGVWSKLGEGQFKPYSKMDVWEELGGGRIQFDALDYQRSALGYIVENDTLLKACFERLSDTGLVEYFFGSKIRSMPLDRQQSKRLVVLEDDAQLSATLLIGADGAQSFVRRMLNIPTREWDYQQSAIVCTVETEKPHENTAWQRFSEQGPVAYLPLPDSLALDHPQHNHFSSIVWSLDTEQAQSIFASDTNGFCGLLARELEERLGAIKSVSERKMFPLRQRHAKAYITDQALLLGDAAHTIHPLAGQGLNLGLNDVQALSRILKDAHDKGYALAHPVLLKRYQRQRQGENLAMMLAMEGFKRLFGSTDPLLRLLRNTGINKVNEHTFIKRQIASKAMGLSTASL